MAFKVTVTSVLSLLPRADGLGAESTTSSATAVLYEQTVETMDLQAVIEAVNKAPPVRRHRRSKEAPDV